jgi:hypothetical protein
MAMESNWDTVCLPLFKLSQIPLGLLAQLGKGQRARSLFYSA